MIKCFFISQNLYTSLCIYVPENLCLIFNDGVVLARALGHFIPHWPEERLNDQ